MSTYKEIDKLVWQNIETETPLRQWKRRLIVAISEEEKQKCKAKIKEYSK